MLGGACTAATDGTSPAPSGSQRNAGTVLGAPGTTVTVGTTETGATSGGPNPSPPGYHEGPCPVTAPTPVEVECGTLTVPESRGAGDRQVQMAVVRLKATGAPVQDPVLYLEGGPGGSAIAGIEAWTDPPSPILEHHDVILVDPRGTGYSSPRLTCDPEFDDPANEAVPKTTLLGRCHQRLVDGGIALDRYNTSDTAADLVDLRSALDIGQWNVLGVSYGTRLALALMARDPAGTRSAVLDSVYPAGVLALDDEPTNAYAALHALLAGCVADRSCAAAYPDLEARLLRTVRDLDRQPVTINVDDGDGGSKPIEFQGFDLVDHLFLGLYSNELIPDIPHAIDLAATGDLQGAVGLLAPETTPGANTPDSMPAGPGGPDASLSPARPGDSDGLYYAVECRESAPHNSPTGVEAASQDIPAALREDLVAGAVGELDSCAAWPVTAQPLDPVASDVPTLLLGGTYDPITPPRWAHEAARTLSRSEVVELPGLGHGTIDGGPCPLEMITAFLDAPTTSVSGLCTTAPHFR